MHGLALRFRTAEIVVESLGQAKPDKRFVMFFIFKATG